MGAWIIISFLVFFLLTINIPLLKHNLLKWLLLHWIALPFFSKGNWLHICGSISGLYLVPLTYLSVLTLIPYCLDEHSFTFQALFPLILSDGSFLGLGWFSHMHSLIRTQLYTQRGPSVNFWSFLSVPLSSLILCIVSSHHLGFPGFPALYPQPTESAGPPWFPFPAPWPGNSQCSKWGAIIGRISLVSCFSWITVFCGLMLKYVKY